MIDKYDAPMLFGKAGERRFHAMAKPTGSTCNLDCTYRFIRTPDGEPGLNYLCAGLKKFFKYATPAIDRIVADLKWQPPQTVQRM